MMLTSIPTFQENFTENDANTFILEDISIVNTIYVGIDPPSLIAGVNSKWISNSQIVSL